MDMTQRTSRLKPRRLLATCGLAAMMMTGTAAACPSALTGQTATVPSGIAGFGRVQGFDPLPLRRGEYVITIDDGPNLRTTPALLDALRAACVKATFFLIGRNAEAHPDLVARIQAEGHSIGNHSYSHPDFSKLDRNAMRKELRQGGDAIAKAATGGVARPPKLFRFPGSAGFPPVVPHNLVEMAGDMGLTVAGIDFSPQDWRNSPPGESFKRLFDRFGESGVIVFHDGQSNTIALLPMVLTEIERRGGRIVSLTD